MSITANKSGLVENHERLGHYRVLYVERTGRVWASRGYRLFYSDDHGLSFKFRAAYRAEWWREAAKTNRLSWRLIRGGFLNMIPLPDGSLVASVRSLILHAEPDEINLRPVLRRPGRTFRFELLPNGTIYTGEYFNNRDRTSVQVFTSKNGGKDWSVCYEFAPGEIRHVHSVRYDPFTGKLIILTGDYGSECKILLASADFQETDRLMEGVQQARAYNVIPKPEGFYLSTDTELEQNYIQILKRNGDLERLVPIAGSGLGACSASEILFFASAAEPSRVNLDPRPTLYGSRDGMHWEVVARWTADRVSYRASWKAALFQIPRIIMPDGLYSNEYLFVTPIGVRKDNGILHRWKLK
ncbi:hypothetical protein DRJ17_04315 [Candidatus Woesearchaeota archaeon]|nr:MAG: hypothetical protein DRJ17_04315 [Candidatus Woesearchaeota archaeon]